jgi:glycosyltransferase involved in cell wall biosynthesis
MTAVRTSGHSRHRERPIGAGILSRVAHADAQPLLSVVVPVFNQAGSILENVRIIRQRVGDALDGPFETIVVSDGSVDRTEERLLEGELEGVRVFHYDRNLGKGYAVKVGSLEARGRWVGYVDADLDLDPASLAEYVAVAERDGLDFAIGSKRHPESVVHYPRSRRVASWLFQQWVRSLIRLNVRDTQVGLKVFRREVVEEVMPFLLVKRYAFDLELLAVAHAFGFRKVREMPIVLDYRFAGTGVRSAAVLRALVDTAAVCYRLRVLRYYQRRRALVGRYGWTRPTAAQAAVTVVCTDAEAAARIEHEDIVVALLDADTPAGRRAAAEAAQTDFVAFLEPGGTPSANWLAATIPFLGRGEIAAVVAPKMAPTEGSIRARAAAAVSESRAGGGSLYYRFTPGNIRLVSDFPASSFVVRRDAYLDVPADTPPEEIVRGLVDRGGVVLYTPETVIVAAPPPLLRPHLDRVRAYGRSRGRSVRLRALRALRPSTVLALLFGLFASLGWLVAVTGPVGLAVWVAGWALYLAAVLVAAAAGGLRFRSVRVAAVTAAGIVATHLAYVAGFLAGFARRTSGSSATPHLRATGGPP